MNVISIDLGGTKTRIAFTTNLGVPSFNSEPIRHRNTHSYEDDLAFIIDSASGLCKGRPIEALGIGVPGRVNDAKTDMIASHNLSEWTNRRFCTDLSRELNCPVYMDNDAVAASLGEGYFSDAKEDFHYLIWGTGISSVSVKYSDNGDITASYIRPNYQNLFDEWESDCGGAALLRKYGKSGEQLTGTEWSDVNALFANYLSEYVNAARPPAIIFGGGLAVHHAGTITGHADEMSVAIRITRFSEDSGLIGGLGLIKRGIVSAEPSLKNV